MKLGIIGCGGIARSHIKAAQEARLELVGVADLSQAALDSLLHDLPQNVRGYTSPETLLKESGAEAIIICTPPCSHAPAAIAALEAGVHVLCEKPLAATVSESRSIENAAAASRATFMVAFRHRFTPAHRSIKTFLDTGELGRIILFQNVFGGPARYMKERWFSKAAISGGGTVMDTSIHSIDLFRHYCGEISSYSGEIDHAFEGTDVEDSAVLSLRAENGALGSLASSWNYGAGVADLRIIAEKGSILYDYRTPTVYQITRLGTPEPETITVPATGGFTEQLIHFAGAVRNGTQPLTGAHDGRRAIEIVEGIYRQRPLASATHHA